MMTTQDVKQPEDRKPKKAKETDITVLVDGEKITVRGYRVEVRGETVEVEKDAISWDFAEAVEKNQIVRIAHMLLGDRYEELRESFRDSRGRVSIEFAEFVSEIMEALPNS